MVSRKLIRRRACQLIIELLMNDVLLLEKIYTVKIKMKDDNRV